MVSVSEVLESLKRLMTIGVKEIETGRNTVFVSLNREFDSVCFSYGDVSWCVDTVSAYVTDVTGGILLNLVKPELVINDVVEASGSLEEVARYLAENSWIYNELAEDYRCFLNVLEEDLPVAKWIGMYLTGRREVLEELCRLFKAVSSALAPNIEFVTYASRGYVSVKVFGNRVRVDLPTKIKIDFIFDGVELTEWYLGEVMRMSTNEECMDMVVARVFPSESIRGLYEFDTMFVVENDRFAYIARDVDYLAKTLLNTEIEPRESSEGEKLMNDLINERAVHDLQTVWNSIKNIAILAKYLP